MEGHLFTTCFPATLFTEVPAKLGQTNLISRFTDPTDPKFWEQQQQKKEVWQCMAKLQPFVATACAYLNVLFSHYQDQNYCEAKYSWKETFGEVICKLNPKSVESKV